MNLSLVAEKSPPGPCSQRSLQTDQAYEWRFGDLADAQGDRVVDVEILDGIYASDFTR